MPSLPPLRKTVWLLPIVFAICGLMVLPGGAFLASAAAGGSVIASPSGLSPSSSLPGSGLNSLPVTGSNLPSSSALTDSPSSLFSGISPIFANAPWVRSLTHTGPTLRALTSLPNINILKGTYTSVSAAVTPAFTSPPASLGLGDFGLGAKTYSYNTSHVLGEVTFNTPPNATNPSATGVIVPDSGGQHQGAIGSPYTFGIQLNTIATNITIPGSNSNFFWTQNVVNWNDTGIHFVDDTFNATGGSIRANTILSGCNNNSAGVLTILDVYGGVFQCVGGTIPVSPASYPVTIQLYNNASTVGERSQVAYGYRIIEAGTGTVYTGVSDVVVFNNPTLAPPATVPGFSVDGFGATPGGFLRDSEIVLVGGIGGDNAAFRSVNGTVNLEYSNASVGGWKNVPSAYNFGGDTGETSVGIADYWTPAHTLAINTGPTLLYGLWNALPWLSVKSGDIQIAGSITPSYGFVFVGNTAPDVYGTNLSWLPTTNAGKFNTYLPPLGAPWTTTYYVQAFAPGSAEYNGTVTASTTTDAITLALAPGVLRAPLYAFSNAQAASLAKNVTGSSTPPYFFNGLTINMNFTFNHLNDYTYPVFDLVVTQGVTQPVYVNNTYEGEDTTFGNFFFYNQPAGSHGVLNPPGEILPYNLGPYNGQINLFGGTGDRVTNETLSGVTFGPPFPQAGGEVVLWQATNAHVWNIDSSGSQGVWIGDSAATAVGAVTASGRLSIYLGTGVYDLGATHTTVQNVLVSLGGQGVLALGSTGGTYSWINVTGGGIGVITGFDEGSAGVHDAYYDEPGTVGLTVNQLNVTGDGSLGANITLSAGTTFNTVSIYDPPHVGAGGIVLDRVTGTTVNSLVANYGWGIDIWNAAGTTISHYVLENGPSELGSIWDLCSDTTVNGFTISNYGAGIFGGIIGPGLTNTAFTGSSFTNVQVGVVLVDPTQTSFTTLAVASAYGVEVEGSSYLTVNTLSVTAESVGVAAFGSTWTTVNAATASGLSVAVFSEDSERTYVTGVTATDTTLSSPWPSVFSGIPANAAVVTDHDQLDAISNIKATTYPVAYYDLDSYDPGVTNVNGTAGWFAVVLNETNYGVFTEIGAYQDWVGLEINAAAEYNVVTQSAFVDSTSYGVAIYNGVDNIVYDNTFIGNNGATGSYSAAHIQAYGDGVNYFYLEGIGNYWADWHTYTPYGNLAPYPLGDDTFDYYPLGGPEGTVAVYFYEDGLASGVTWSVTFDGATQSSANYWIVFYVLPGTYSFTAGGVTGYTETPGTGSVSAAGSSVDEYLDYAATYSVTLTETGLPSGTSWSAIFDGTTGTSTTSTITFTASAGTDAYQIPAIANYTASPSSGTVTVSGAYNISIAFTQVKYAVTVTESGLASGTTWSATVNGVKQSTAGTTLTFYLANGSYTYSISNVSGYTLTGGSGPLKVAGSPVGVSGGFSPNSTTSVVSTNTYNTGFAVAIAIAVIALLIGLIALFWRRKKPEPVSTPPAAWSPPAGGAGGAGGTGGESGWSEGPVNPPS
jgi:hypothetical protein